MTKVKSDIEIAREAKMEPIKDILAKMNVPDESAAFSPMGRHIAKINLNDICFYDLVPERHLRHYFQVKNEICEWIFDNYERPNNYSFWFGKKFSR